MGKLIVELPDEMHSELKKKAATDHKTLKDIITELIDEYLYSPAKPSPSKKKTGLCGSWSDKRSADEIIKDIKSSRKWFTERKN